MNRLEIPEGLERLQRFTEPGAREILEEIRVGWGRFDDAMDAYAQLQ